jgi:hypothetical protein
VPAILDRLTGKTRPAQIFVAVLGASNFTYAEASWTQALARPDRCPRPGFRGVAAFEAAEEAGLSICDCYKASIDTWHRAYPDQKRKYASMQAVEVILKAKVSLRVPD